MEELRTSCQFKTINRLLMGDKKMGFMSMLIFKDSINKDTNF